MASAPPPAQAAQSYQDKLLSDAKAKYAFINQYDPIVSTGQGDGYAETWPADEEGEKDYPRPKEFPMGRIGVQVFRQDKFGPDDLAAEFLHVDKYANETREKLLKSLTPVQKERLKHISEDYKYTIQRGDGEERAMQNATDSALRGYAVGQWPREANNAMQYSADQKSMLDKLSNYMKTGVREISREEKYYGSRK